MKEDNELLQSLLGAAILLVLIFSFAFVAADADGWEGFRSFLAGGASGWAQAFGSFVAIGIAYKIGQAQISAGRALEASRRAHENERRLLVIDAATESLERSLELIEEEMTRHELPFFLASSSHETRLREAALTIKSINLMDCPAAALIHPLTLLPSAAEGFANQLSAYQEILHRGSRSNAERAASTLFNGHSVVAFSVKNIRGICRRELEQLKHFL